MVTLLEQAEIETPAIGDTALANVGRARLIAVKDELRNTIVFLTHDGEPLCWANQAEFVMIKNALDGLGLIDDPIDSDYSA